MIQQPSGETPLKRAVNYARASLDATGEQESVDRQHKANSHLILARGWTEIGREKDNSISAYGGKKRPGWDRVLEMMRSGEVDVVVAWHLDRITRSMTDLEKLITVAEESGVGIVTTTGDFDLSSDTGRMVARILAAVARAEVERKAARQKLANATRADQGDIFSGGPRPFGYEFSPDPDVQYAVVEDEAALIKRAAQDVLGGESLREIARQWSELGYQSPLRTGRLKKGSSTEPGWSPVGVKGILVSPRYAGLVTYKGEVVGKGNWSAILDEPTHRQLVKKLTDPSRLNSSGVSTGRTPQTLLTGIAVCGVCGSTVRTNSNHSGRKMYACRPGSHVSPPRDAVDREVHSAIIAVLQDPAALAAVLALGGDEAEEALAEIARIDSKLEEYADALAADVIDLTQYAAATKALKPRRDAAQRVLEHTDRGSVVEGLSVGTPKVGEQWKLMNLHRQRAVIERFLTVELLPVGRKTAGTAIRTWDPEQHIRIELRRGDE